MSSATSEKGQVLILSVFFMLLTFAYATLLFRSSVLSLNVANANHEREQALLLADAGIERALWCLSQSEAETMGCGGGVGDSYTGETFTFAGGDVTTVVTAVIDSEKEILSTGTTARGTTRTVVVNADGENGEALIFALLGGSGTATYLENGATIEGEIHMNGDFICSSQNGILGDLSLSGESTLDNCNVTGDVKAHDVEDTTVVGDAYYQTITASTVTGELHPDSPDPETFDLPYDEEHFTAWRQEAAAGGTTVGDVDLTGPLNELGPQKIEGSLTFGLASQTTLSGTVYVTGDLTIRNNATITLSPTYGAASAIILVEGKVDVGNNLSILSSDTGSYIFFIGLDDSFDSSDPAFQVNNNAEAAIFYAANGLIEIGNNLVLNGVVGASLHLGQNSTVVYEQELENINFNTDTGNPVLVYRTVAGTRNEL